MAVASGALSPSGSPYSAGQVVDRFTLRKRLAVGGSGEVWVASNRTTGGTVALKLVRGSVSASNAARFRQEAALSAALTHRNIVQVFDFFEAPDGTLGLVMECLRGETARERLARVGAFTPRAAVALVTQALTGLAHAHDHRIVHRDIKPPNIFLATDPDGSTTTKVLDFGIAHTPTGKVQTLDGQLLGTPKYMSPEQIRGEALDGRSDVFSVAIVLYELLTGRCPFAAPFPTASLAAVLEAKVESDPRIPPALWEVMAKALSKSREARPASARAFADALRAAVTSNDGVLARELHRSRPPPPLFAGEAKWETARSDTGGASPPRPRATSVRARAVRVVVGVTAVSLLILAVAAVRGPRAATVGSMAAEPTHATAPLPPSVTSVTPASIPDPLAVAPTPSLSPSPSPRSTPAHAPAQPVRRAPTGVAARRPTAPKTILRDPGF